MPLLTVHGFKVRRGRCRAVHYLPALGRFVCRKPRRQGAPDGPGEHFNGCSMSTPAERQAITIEAIADELAKRDKSLAVTALTNIAEGWWNAGRAVPITAEEYAQYVLLAMRR